MKKKLFLAISIMICAVVFAMSFAGCKGTSGAEEFNAFKEKIITVMNDNGIKIQELDQNNNSDNVVVTNVAKYIDVNNIDEVKAFVLQDGEVKNNAKRVEEVRQEMYEQALFTPLVVGDGMVNNHNADTIYDTSVFVDCWWKTYMEFKVSGTVTTINAYSPASDGDCVYAGVMYLDYKSEDNYNFVMLLVWEDGRIGYRNGNAQKQFCYFDYDPTGDGSIIYCSSKEGEGYISENSQAVKNCYDLVASQFDEMKVENYEYLKNQKYTIDESQWKSLCAKYFQDHKLQDEN